VVTQREGKQSNRDRLCQFMDHDPLRVFKDILELHIMLTN